MFVEIILRNRFEFRRTQKIYRIKIYEDSVPNGIKYF